jgi:hypothetical protein
MAQFCTLKQGWNELDALEQYFKDKWATEAKHKEAVSFVVYHAITLAFLGIGVAGWILMRLGSVLVFVAGDDDGDVAEA